MSLVLLADLSGAWQLLSLIFLFVTIITKRYVMQAHPQSANLPALINYLAEGMGEPSAAQLIEQPPRGSSIQDWLQQGRTQPPRAAEARQTGTETDQEQADRLSMVREMLRQANVLRPGSASGSPPSSEPTYAKGDGALEGEVRSRDAQQQL